MMPPFFDITSISWRKGRDWCLTQHLSHSPFSTSYAQDSATSYDTFRLFISSGCCGRKKLGKADTSLSPFSIDYSQPSSLRKYHIIWYFSYIYFLLSWGRKIWGKAVAIMDPHWPFPYSTFETTVLYDPFCILLWLWRERSRLESINAVKPSVPKTLEAVRLVHLWALYRLHGKPCRRYNRHLGEYSFVCAPIMLSPLYKCLKNVLPAHSQKPKKPPKEVVHFFTRSFNAPNWGSFHIPTILLGDNGCYRSMHRFWDCVAAFPTTRFLVIPISQILDLRHPTNTYQNVTWWYITVSDSLAQRFRS